MQRRALDRYEPKEGFILYEKREQVIADVTKRTGFMIDEEYYKGTVYDNKRVRSLIYKGTYHGSNAMLKLQGLRVDSDEEQIMNSFNRQNLSKLIRLPEVYKSQRWTQKKGYGYMIMEYVPQKRVFDVPFATKQQMTDFAKFYQEYRTKAVTKQFIKQGKADPIAATFEKVDFWKNLCEKEGRLNLGDYAPYLMQYYPIAAKHLTGMPTVLSHTVLVSNHISKDNRGRYVIFSNPLWGYMFEWADITMPVWGAWTNIRDTSYTSEELIKYVNTWLSVFKTIPVVKKDSDFERKFNVHMLNRVIGSILADFGVGEKFKDQDQRKYMNHLVGLMQELFEYYKAKLERV